MKDMYLSHSINTKYFYNYSDNNDIIYRNRIFHAHNLSNCCVREINNKIYSIAYIHAVYPPTLLENLPDDINVIINLNIDLYFNQQEINIDVYINVHFFTY